MAGQERILLVEQSRENRELLKRILREEYQLAEAESGRKALELLREDAGEISLILLDSTVLDEQGQPLLERLRREEKLSSIPVVAITEQDSPDQQAEALARGAEDYVSRPYNEQIVLHRVSSVIRGVRQCDRPLPLRPADRPLYPGVFLPAGAGSAG